MPPKKKEEVVEKQVLGRFRSNLKMGIVGLPNVGKSTLFNVLTKMGIPAENFPFCTINPNKARVFVPDERYDLLMQAFRPKSGSDAAFLDIVDIAGLVRGAAAGEGLGNAFLSHIQGVDGIFHVCRAFEDADVVHVEDRVDPVADLEIIHAELRAKDTAFIEDHIAVLSGKGKHAQTKEQKEELAIAEKVADWLKADKDIRFGEWSNKEVDFLNTIQLITAKPVVYLVNLTEDAYIKKKNKWLAKIFGWVKEHGGEPIIPFSGSLENKLFDMPEDEKLAYLKEQNAVSALPKIITTGFTNLQLIYFFTAGPMTVKCWQIRKGSKAPQAAGAIHSDFERGFICAEVMKYDELRELGSEQAVKAAGKYRQEGKGYTVQDGDVIFFKFNVTAEKKK